MAEIRHLVSGPVDNSQPPFLWYLDPVPHPVARAYLQAYTQPADLVIDPFCQGPTILRQAIDGERRVVGSSYDPLAVRLTRAALNPPTRQQLDAAVTRLGDEPRMDVPFHQHLEALYAITCPRCNRATPAAAFTWDRDSATILHAEWLCAHCGHETAPPSFGEAHGERIERRGLQYWHAVDRIAPAGDPLRERAEQLLEIYTPRNLYALGSILIKIESLFVGETAHILKLLLLACMEACSSLHRPQSPSRGHGLRPSARFVERNVWRAFVRAAGDFPTADDAPPILLTDDLNAILDDRGISGAAVLPLGVQRLVASLPHDCAAIVAAAPPRPRPAAWALSWLWTGWLFEHREAAPLKPLLRQWRTDWDWYRRSMQAAFRALRGPLRQDAPLVLVFDDPEPPLVEALGLALAGAGFVPEAWIHQENSRAYRLASRPGPAPPAPPDDVEALGRTLRAEAAAAARKVLIARGEPLTWEGLRLPIYRHLAASGLLGQVAIAEELPASRRTFLVEQTQKALEEAGALVALPGTRDDREREPLRWWLADPSSAAPPLATRVEAAVHQLLLGSLILTTGDLASEIYRRFPEGLTPDADLIEICLRAYGQEITPGHWQLRPEDQPECRADEISDIREQLTQLGRRLNYRVSARTEPAAEVAPGHLPAFDILWRDPDRPAYAFAIQWTARVHDLLLAKAPANVLPCLVIPGGRAELVSLKLQRDPRLRRAVDEAGWQFIKYRHLRRILTEEALDRHTLKQIVGLDPIIEQDGAQMPLF
jgi:hypothetical protein